MRVPRPRLFGLGRGSRVELWPCCNTQDFLCGSRGWRPNFSPGGENTHLCYTTPKTQAPPSERGFFFAARATRHPPASLLRARLRFATGQRDSFSKSVAVIPNVFCPNYYARRLKNESVCDSVCRQSISDSWLGNLREYLAHLV
jgi:hypothetical protein